MNEPTESERRYGIFLSSTNDPVVRRYRQIARSLIESPEFSDRWFAVEMDQFTPSTATALERCHDLVLTCRIYVGILGPFYGTVVDQLNMAYTEYEYITAQDHGKQIAIFLLPSTILSESDPNTILDQAPLLSRQGEFKKRVNSAHMTRPVSDLDDFANHFKRFLQSIELPPSADDGAPKEDWGFAPDVDSFFGRDDELATLERWIVGDRCRLVSIVGMGGIGKTELSVRLGKGGIGKTDLTLKLAQGVRSDFKYVIWRRLLNAPPISDLLTDLVKFLSDQQEIRLPASVSDQISRLLYYLQQNRCLIILDNVEAILRGGDQTGLYQDGYELYGELFERIGATSHDSCLLLNSREKPHHVALLEGKARPVRTLELRGLDEVDGRRIFDSIGSFVASEFEWKELIDLYDGNPFALELAAKHISEVFFGNISRFLHDGRPLFHDLNDLLIWHFDRLSDQEKEVLFWLALNREPLSFTELEDYLLDAKSKQQVSSTLQSVQRRMPLEKSSERFTLQPVLIEYMTSKLIDTIVDEFVSGNLSLLHRHALQLALATDYVRESQVRLILKPIKERLLSTFETQDGVESRLDAIVRELQSRVGREPSYAGGNLLNMFSHLGVKLDGKDLSRLAIWQAYLQHINLYDVNLSNSDLKNCVFTQTFGPVSSHAFSPDGTLLAASESNGNINVWRVGDFQILLTLKGHINWIFALAFSPDGQTLASGGEDKTVRLWDVSSGKCLNTLQGHTNSVWAVAFSPDGDLLASGGEDETIRLWDPALGMLLGELREHQRKVFCLDFSTDGRMLASASADKTIRVWNVENWSDVRVIQGHSDTVRGVAFSPDSRILASAGWDHVIKLWDVRSGDCVRTLVDPGALVHSVAFSPDGQILASSNEEGIIRIWDVRSGQATTTLQRHVGEVWKVAFSRDGQKLASGGYDGILRIWDTRDWSCRHTMQGYVDWVQAVALSPHGRIVASSNADLSIRIWDIDTGRCVKTLRGHTGWAFAMAFSPDGRRLVTGSDDRTIKIWNVEDWTCLNVLQDHANWVQTVAFSPDNRLIASGSDDRTIKLWDIESGRCIRTLEGHEDGIWSVVFMPDGQQLVSGSEDSTIRRWDVHTGRCLQTYSGHTDRIHSVGVSPDGTTLASCSDDKTVRIWDARTGRCLSVQEGHSSWVMSLAFHPHGGVVASGSKDQTVRIWDIRRTWWGQLLGIPTSTPRVVLNGHSGGIWSVAFGQDGKTLASASEDGSIRLWETWSGECLMILRQRKPYDGLNISGVTGLTDAQRTTLRVLGAVEAAQ